MLQIQGWVELSSSSKSNPKPTLATWIIWHHYFSIKDHTFYETIHNNNQAYPIRWGQLKFGPCLNLCMSSLTGARLISYVLFQFHQMSLKEPMKPAKEYFICLNVKTYIIVCTKVVKITCHCVELCSSKWKEVSCNPDWRENSELSQHCVIACKCVESVDYMCLHWSHPLQKIAVFLSRLGVLNFDAILK